ncbi:helix-turn-helix domain-containing protein [Vibrio navarrensis]|uniref:helix-turn-helix domain-containing protein n=1 Tax=Vibrio navarrensis TaxID=29495 RepID=UPI001D040856|nr:helix-turn-helix domain-containing protein [Vibrio navarrensis]
MNLVQLLHEGNSCAPTRCKQYSFDVNQQAQSLSAWDQKYNQHSAGQFHGYLDEIKLPGLHLFEEYTSHAVHQECCVNPSAVWIGFSMDSQRPKVNGLQAQTHQLMIRPAKESFELATPQDFHIFGIVIERDLLLDGLQYGGQGRWENAQWETAVLVENSVPHHGCWSLVNLIRDALSPLSILGQKLLEEGAAQAHLHAMLRTAVMDRLSAFQVSPEREPRSYHTRRQALRRLYKYIDHNGEYPLSISEMCAIACVSQRTLHNCFEQELGVSPATFLRECRLNAVRRVLLDQSQQRAISDVALGFGFYHLGTFNHYYKRLFGETPSQTRTRASQYQKSAVVKRFAAAQSLTFHVD